LVTLLQKKAGNCCKEFSIDYTNGTGFKRVEIRGKIEGTWNPISRKTKEVFKMPNSLSASAFKKFVVVEKQKATRGFFLRSGDGPLEYKKTLTAEA